MFTFLYQFACRSHPKSPDLTTDALSVSSIPLFSISPEFTYLWLNPEARLILTGMIWSIVFVLYNERSNPNLLFRNLVSNPPSRLFVLSGFNSGFCSVVLGWKFPWVPQLAPEYMWKEGCKQEHHYQPQHS